MASILARLAVASVVTMSLGGCVIAPLGTYRELPGAQAGAAVDLLPPEPYVEVIPVFPGYVWIGGSWGWSVGRHDHGWRGRGGHWRRR